MRGCNLLFFRVKSSIEKMSLKSLGINAVFASAPGIRYCRQSQSHMRQCTEKVWCGYSHINMQVHLLTLTQIQNTLFGLEFLSV